MRGSFAEVGWQLACLHGFYDAERHVDIRGFGMTAGMGQGWGLKHGFPGWFKA
ncbi:MAG: hypothetical protein IPP74_15220 [Alphaproteobacteria bacterium]|nr:hypothetical protein [Alphaproteobacteria bacterium]